MRQVNVVGTPPQDWIDHADILTAKLYKITDVLDARSLTLVPDLQAVDDMPAPQVDRAILGNIDGSLHLQISNENSELIFNEGESYLKKNWKKRTAVIRGLLPDDWNQGLDANVLQDLCHELKEIARLAFTKRNEPHWRDDRVRDWLLGQFQNKCWYSEASDSVSPIHVEHYRPKSSVVDDQTKEESEGYWWMAFDYTNYRIGGHFLNSKKGNYFPLHNAVKATCCGGVPKELESPVLIDPISNAASQVSYDKHEDVCLAVCSDEELDEGHEDRLEFEATKKLIGLNEYDRLNHKRALIWDECNDQIERYKETNAAPNLTKINRAGVTTRVKKMVEYTSEFSSVALACLQKNAPLSLINAVSP